MSDVKTVPKFSIVVPVYQSADSVRELVARVTLLFDRKLEQSFEIILVDDGSDRIQTWATLEELANSDPRVIAIRLMRNYGKPSAVLCGFSYARGDWVITIDDDLQQSPEDIAALIAFKDHDVVVASYRRKKHSWGVRATSWIKGQFDAHVLHLPFRMSPLKLIKRQTLNQVLKIRGGRPYIPALLAYATSDFKAVPLEHHASKAGKSRYNYFRRLRQFSNLAISYSGFFSRLWAIIGLALVFSGSLLLCYLLVEWMWSASRPFGAAQVIAALLIVGGMILMAIGITGEYLIRLVEITNERPPFVVRQIAGTSATEDQN